MSDDVDSEERVAADGSADAEDADNADGADVGAGADTDADTDADAAAASDSLADRVAEYDDDLAEEVRDLTERVEALEDELAERESEVADLTDRLKRKQADFQNYKKRSEKRRERLEDRATEDLVTRMVDVRDNLVRALDQDEGADLRDGLSGTLKEFDRVLADENVTPVEPDPGEEIDPERHEVMMRVDADQPPGTVVDVYRPGYEMAGKVIQTAQVTVSDDEA